MMGIGVVVTSSEYAAAGWVARVIGAGHATSVRSAGAIAAEVLEPAVDPAPRGINLFLPSPSDLFWSAVLLVLIAVVFYKLIMPKLTAVLDERTQLIDGGLRQAEEVKAQADHALEMRRQVLEEARADAARTREEAKEEGAAIVKEAKAKASEEAQRTTEQANQQIAASRQAAAVALRQEVGDIATQLAGKIVGASLLDPNAKSAAIDEFLDELDEQTPRNPSPTVDPFGDQARSARGAADLADGGDAVGSLPSAVDVTDPDAAMTVAEPDQVVSRPWDPDSADPYAATEPSEAELATQAGAQD